MDWNLYTDKGWLDWAGLYPRLPAFTLCVGGRGIGKTYGALEYLAGNDIHFLYLRRTQTQADICRVDGLNPYRKICANNGWNIHTEIVAKYVSGFFGEEASEPFGYIAALSTFANIRGFDMPVDVILFDEFIPELHERPIKHEYTALMNVYETVNRNRELEGKPPVKLICIGNSNVLASPILHGFGVEDILIRMAKADEEVKQIGTNLLIIRPMHSPISEAKAGTVAYQGENNADFAAMAVGNAFVFDDVSDVQPRNLQDYRCICQVGDIRIWQSKSTGKYYAADTGECKRRFTTTSTDVRRFASNYPAICWAVHMGLMQYASAHIKNTLMEVLK